MGNQTVSQRDELGRFVKRQDISPRSILAPPVANNKSADSHDSRAANSYNVPEPATDTETFSGPVILIVIVAVVCGLIAFIARNL